jgi:hypothetical protein
MRYPLSATRILMAVTVPNIQTYTMAMSAITVLTKGESIVIPLWICSRLTTSERIPDIQGYTVPHSSSAAISPMTHTPQYYATHHQPRSHTMPIQQYLSAAPISHSSQLQYPGHMHPDSVKTEHSPEWEAAVASQHVDPIHPFAVSGLTVV